MLLVVYQNKVYLDRVFVSFKLLLDWHKFLFFLFDYSKYDKLFVSFFLYCQVLYHVSLLVVFQTLQRNI